MNPAENLILDYLDLILLEPNSNEWGSANFNKNMPRFYRLQRIKSCLNALELHPIPIMKFEQGQFLENRTIKDIEEVERLLSTSFKLDYDKYVEERNINQLSVLFSSFLTLLVNLHRVRNTFKGTLAASNHYLTPIFVAKQISHENANYEKTILKTLVYLLNPKSRQISREKMIEDFDFPDVDLVELDFEWL
jgi:hypothetical protein